MPDKWNILFKAILLCNCVRVPKITYVKWNLMQLQFNHKTQICFHTHARLLEKNRQKSDRESRT